MPDGTERGAYAQQLVARQQYEEVNGERIDGLASWDGTLSGADVVWFDLLGESATIRIKERSGTFAIRNQIAEDRVAIVGSGMAPFS